MPRNRKFMSKKRITAAIILAGILVYFAENNLIISYPTFILHNENVLDENAKLLQEFKSSLFCPIIHKTDVIKYNKLLNNIYSIQYNNSCDLNRKYYILSLDKIGRRKGLMAFIDHVYTPPFSLSIFLNRTFIIHTNNDQQNPYFYLPQNGRTIPHLCENRTGRNCIFKSVSNCSQKQIFEIIKYSKKHNSYYAINDIENNSFCKKESRTMIPKWFDKLTEDYMVIDQLEDCHLFWDRGPEMNRNIVEIMIKNRNWNINYYQYTAIIWSILLRMQNNVQNIVYNQVKETLIKYKWKSKQQTISLPIRASDKCIPSNIGSSLYWHSKLNWRWGNFPEMECLQNIEWINIAKKIPILHRKDVNKLIITSEDNTVMDFMKNYSFNEYFTPMFNDFDEIPNCGQIIDLKEKINDEFKSFNYVISMLSTLKLQMHSNYYVIQKLSNWAHAIWLLSSCIHCNILPDPFIDNNRYCVSIDLEYNNKYIFWDYNLFNGKHVDLTHVVNSTFSMDINHTLSNISINNCYRENRFPFEMTHAWKLYNLTGTIRLNWTFGK
eukprot:366219_1